MTNHSLLIFVLAKSWHGYLNFSAFPKMIIHFIGLDQWTDLRTHALQCTNYLIVR